MWKRIRERKSKTQESERRRFERVQLDASQMKSSDVYMVWPNGERTEILDMSFMGAALKAPKNFHTEAMNYESLELKVDQEVHKIEVEVAWRAKDFLGIRFSEVDPLSRVAINEFLDGKLLGLRLRAVDKKFYSKSEGFDLWLQAREGVNLYVWFGAEEEVIRARCEWDDELLIYDESGKEGVFEMNSKKEPKATLQKDFIGLLGQAALRWPKLKDLINKVEAATAK